MKRRIRPCIQETATALIFLNMILLAGHIEWWQPSLDRHLNGWLILGLIGSTIGLLCLVDPEDPIWKREDQ